jgi:cytochrome c oxidase cbb3-type subunit III
MKKDDKNLMSDHEYDGIHELDNPLPKWWLVTFYATIVFSFFYAPYYHFFGGLNPLAEFRMEVARLKLDKPKSTDEGDTKALLLALSDSDAKKLGESVFATKCIACHGPQAQGVIGPNLTDDYWISGSGSAPDIYKVVRDGVPAKGMPPWGAIISQTELAGVAAYIASLRGSQPANPKAPQGDLHKPNEQSGMN